MNPPAENTSKIHAGPLPLEYATFLFAIEQSAKARTPQHNNWVGRPRCATLPPDYSMANRKIAYYTLGRGRAYMFEISSTNGYMGPNNIFMDLVADF